MEWQTIGFDFIKNFFKQALINKRLSHAYLFSGQEMIGKRTFALELAKKINNFNGPGINPDLVLIDPVMSESGQSISIDEIRRAKNFLSLGAFVGPYKFAVINDAHTMTEQAQNAFLKLLEEVSGLGIIILVTPYPNVLLPTIISRCQELKFLNHSAENIKQALEKIGVSQERIDFLRRFASGRLGLAITLADDEKYSEMRADIEELVKLKKLSLVQRLKFSQNSTVPENGKSLERKLLFWTLYEHLTVKDGNQKLLQGLVNLNFNLSSPQFNRRLLMDNFFVNL